ncbi:hypothetical protein PPERSA_09023 [Pseudocohnilembus persalinus]|uniref:Uncharacterized protein n=1 Tax=Pseudocohnilembus persalinus TaxID=266149 RepID=A0A0V0R350_PSEPJ|nr:hypothetical protein PPERSA_09023 [Pseudocohnilembus persalinus]|eukprot:KRX08919.1 hypothetical protein PPERSA_09023 [Pseudocohnilembus persalinus]
MELLEKQLQKETKNNQYQGNKKYKHNNPKIPENQLKKHFRGLPQTVPAQWKQLGAIYTNDGGESYIFNKQLNDNFPAIITKYSMPKYLSLAFKLGFFDKNEMKQTYDNLDQNQQKKVKFFLNQNQFIGVESEDINTFHLTHDPFNEIDDVLNFIIERNKKYQNLVKTYSQTNISPLEQADLEKNGFFNSEEYINNQKKADFIINYYKTHLTEYYWDKVNIKKQDDYVSQIQQIFQQNFNFLCADKNFNYKTEEIKIPIEDEIMTNKQTYQELLDSAYIYRNQQNEDSNELQNPVFAIENELNTTFQLNPINNNFNLNTSYVNNNNTSFNLENNERQNDFSLEALVNQNNISNNNSVNGDNQIGQNFQNQKEYAEDHIFNNQINDNNNNGQNQQNEQNDVNYLSLNLMNQQDDEISEDLPEIKEDQLLKKLEKIKQVIKKIKEQDPQKFIDFLAQLKDKEHDKMLKMFQVLEKTINESSNYYIEMQQPCIKQKNYSVAFQIYQRSNKTNRLKIKHKGNAEHQLNTVAHVKALMKACTQFFDYNEPISQFENLEINQIVQYISDIRYDFLLRKYCNQEIQVEKVIPQMEIKSSDSEEKVIKKRKKNDIKEMEKNLILLNKQHEKEQQKIQQIKNEKKLKKRNPGTLLNYSKSKIQNQLKVQDDEDSSSIEILQNFDKQPLNINIVKKQDNSIPVLNTRCKKSAAPLKQVQENNYNYNDNNDNKNKEKKNTENQIINSKNDQNYINNSNSQNDSYLNQSNNSIINNDDNNYPKKVRQKSKLKKIKKLNLSSQSSYSSSDDDNNNNNEINYNHTNKNYLQKEKKLKQNRHQLNQIQQVKPQQQISKNLQRKSQKPTSNKEYLGSYKKQTQHSIKSADKSKNNNQKKPVTITISDSE